MRSHSDGVRSDVYRIPMLIGESESLYNCKMHDLSSFSQRCHFLNRLSDIEGAEVVFQRGFGVRPLLEVRTPGVTLRIKFKVFSHAAREDLFQVAGANKHLQPTPR